MSSSAPSIARPARAGRDAEDPRFAEASGLTWLLAPVAAALTIGLMLVLGAPLGRTIFPPVARSQFWPSALPYVKPEPTEQARYLISLVGAILLPVALLVCDRRGWLVRPSRATGGLRVAVQVALAAVLGLGVLCKRDVVAFGTAYFTLPSLVVAVIIAAGLGIVLSIPRLLAAAGALLRERSRAVRWASFAVAALAVVIWLLPAIELDTTVAKSNVGTWYDLQYTFDEGLSVVNGHTPLVNYVAQYGSLWPYVAAIPLHFGHGSLGAYTTSMTTVSALCMLAVYGALRRVTRSSVAALALFVVFVAMTCFIALGNTVERYSFADYFGAFPMRYAGPYFTCWLLARHLSGERPRRTVWIFLVAGLTVMNNGDFGVPSLGATIIALAACAARPWDRRRSALAVAEGFGGLIAGYALVSIVTIARTGSLPDLGLVFKYAHLFVIAGYQMVRMPWFGTWVTVYLTFCAALVLATLHVVRRSEDRVSTGMLAWVGIFGLGAGAYYAGRSLSQVLIELFSVWALAVVLLVAVTVRRLVHRGTRPGIAELALFVGFGLCACSIAQFPTPWGQIKRLTTPAPFDLFQPNSQVDFVEAHVRPGRPVDLLTYLGQRTSREAHVDDVNPFSGLLSMPTKQQLAQSLRMLRQAGGDQVVLYIGTDYWPEMLPAIEHDGFRLVAASAPPTTPTRYLLLTNAPQGDG